MPNREKSGRISTIGDPKTMELWEVDFAKNPGLDAGPMFGEH